MLVRRLLATTVAVAATAAPAAVGITVLAGPADAAGTYYRNCDALHRDFKHGVAKSYRASQKQVRDGYGRPAYGKRAQKVYWANYTRLDRDKDGTACEA